MSCKDELGNVCTHLVRIHMFSITNPAVPELSALNNAQRVYGANGIKIDMVSGQTLRLTAKQKLVLNTLDTSCGWNSASDEQRLLFSLGGAPRNPNIIRIYYLNRISLPSGAALNGCAGHEPMKPALAVAATGSPWTMAHELGHVLLGSAFRPVHASVNTNLMFSPTTSISAAIAPGLTAAQVIAIKASRLCVAC